MTNPIIGQGWHFPPEFDEQGNIRLTNDQAEISQAIRIILSTAPGQRVMRPDFGCRIHELVFDLNNMATASLASRYIQEALGRWEPRINVRQVDVVPEAEYLMVSIKYRVVSTHSNRSLVFPFYLIPEESNQHTFSNSEA